MNPSIEAEKNGCCTGYDRGLFMGKATEEKTLKDITMLKRLNDISALPDIDKEHIVYTNDGLIKSAKPQAL